MIEIVEPRLLLATVAVNAGDIVRTVDSQLLGVNLATWDSALDTPQTEQMVEAAGLTNFRFPGGSESDDFHFNAPPTYDGEGTDSSIASFIAAVGGIGIATVDYGSGSPQEAAAFLAYLDGSVDNTTVIGDGQEWSDSANEWQTVDWQTAGYWASLRAAAPLPVDDGLNFLRLDHPAPFGTQYWEIGNEVYGSWEVDHHTVEHDPATYISFAVQFQALANQIAPAISIGLDVDGPGSDYNNWTPDILQQAASQGLTVGFLSDHNYMQAPGDESDSGLLLDTVSDPNSNPDDPGDPYDWAVRGAEYESLLNEYLGAAAAKHVQLLATEFNSVYSNPGKQTTSLVNGLFVADSLGSLLETPYDGADVWDLRNGWETGNNNSSSLYGWREGGDYGLLGDPSGSAPSSGAYIPYPTYFAEELASKIVQNGGTVVQATSSEPNLTTYAVVEPNGDLELLVINKNASSAITGQFQISGFAPADAATLWQYGEAQDTAQSESPTGASALAQSTVSLTINGSSFNFSFPAYSMSVLELGRVTTGTGSTGPTITSPAVANPSVVIGTTAFLSVDASDPGGPAGLTYLWSTASTPPTPVSYGTNGTTAAQTVQVTFTAAGTYQFQVTVTDASGNTATSDVTVVVKSILTSIVVVPPSVTLGTGASEHFGASGYDQFGNLLSPQPVWAWSVSSGGGTIDPSTGLYTANSTPGTSVVEASSAGVSGQSVLTIVSTGVVISPTFDFALTSFRRGRFVAMLTITNAGDTAIAGWVLQFEFAASISHVANGVLVSHNGSRYRLGNIRADRVIAPGHRISIVVTGNSKRVPAAPIVYVLSSEKL